VHNLIAGELELPEQFRQSFGRVAVEIVQEDNTLAPFFQLCHHRINHLRWLVHGEVARVDVCRKDRNVALGEIRKKLRRCLEVGEAEERRNAVPFGRRLLAAGRQS
jgi:hypothetical protein